MQARVGARDRLAEIGGHVVRDFMPDQHRELFEKLPYLLVGSVDASGRPWASMVVGAPGFVRAPDARTLRVEPLGLATDPALADLRARLALGAPIGLLGVELSTRRRNRANGRVAARDEGAFTVGVEESFGNCPQYIQSRHVVSARSDARGEVRRGAGALDREGLAIVAAADTCFIASAVRDETGGLAQLGDPVAETGSHASSGDDRVGPGRAGGAQIASVDVSHRGGRQGFVRATTRGGTTTLTLPDYAGNNFFNTLGNLTLHPHAGLLFADFDRGHVLALTGDAVILHSGAEVTAAGAGVHRLVRVTVREWLFAPGALAFVWSAPELAPQLRPR